MTGAQPDQVELDGGYVDLGPDQPGHTHAPHHVVGFAALGATVGQQR